MGGSSVAIRACRSWHFQSRILERKTCHILSYHVYCIPSDVQLKDQKAFRHRNSLTARAPQPVTKADCTVVELIEHHGRVGEDIGYGDSRDVREMSNHSIPFKISEE